MPMRFTEVHISSKVSSMCLRAKDHHEGTKVAVFPSLCAPQRDQSGSAVDWRSPKSGDQEHDGRPGYPRGASDPERRAEWTTVLRHGHLRSAPVVVDACSRTEWETPTLRAVLVCLHAPCLGASWKASFLSSDAQMRLHH